MERTKPEYLNDLPRDRGGIGWTFIVGGVLLAAIIGAAMIYAETVKRWNQRYSDKPHTSAAANPLPARSSTPLPASPAVQKSSPVQIDRCLDGIALRKLPGGGWENLPGVSCLPEKYECFNGRAYWNVRPGYWVRAADVPCP